MNDNRLGTSVSPYLRLHADNPVDWREWGPEAFAEARERGVPVLVSVGYATCHWCHVMARESFDDPEIGELLRRDFVSVKVDREERPDVDASLMASASAFTQQLGWPLTTFLTPDGHVFFAGTYFPPTPVGQVPAFRQILAAVLDAWTERRHEVDANASAIATAIRQGAVADATARSGEGGAGADPGLPSVDAIRAVTDQLSQAEDTTYGGFGGAPKFPSTPLLEFLAGAAADGDAEADGLLDRSLHAIRASELTDADGGVFRYATKRDWSVPHYERMLYDNAGLLAVAGAEQARGIADFLRDTLRRADGAFVAAQDSESTIDGRRVEGEWYRRPIAERAQLDPPPLDDQVLTGWNGLAIRGLAIAGARHGDPELVALSRGAADAVLAAHVRDGHVTVRSSTPRGASSAPAAVEDVGLLAEGLLELALVTGEVSYATVARSLVDDGLAERFDVDPVLAAAGTATGEQPQTAMRSGTVALASAAATLGALTGDEALRVAAARLIADRARTGTERPLGHADALGVALALQRPSREIVVVTSGTDDPMRAVAHRGRRPGTVVATTTPEQARDWAEAGFSLFEGRDVLDPAAYVCHDRVCELPSRSADALARQIA
ncbi:thioredoxin domain-containing protein [Curtobacterium flaccumfaciens pv. flaccumfaciens]|uniref:thioredoxin domain-containing protein n=1 Tax=Curtobacterium flaccumfaciens TaxID=2035 RepID=UPI003995E172